jgi:HK97 family phage major capsid protein
MRSITVITNELDDARHRRSGLASEAATLIESDASYDGSGNLRSGHQTRYDRLSTGIGKVDREIETLDSEWRSAMEAGISSGAFAVEPGDNCGSSANRSVASPWAPTPSYGAGNELRGKALTAVERDAYASDGARERATKVIESDETDAVARYVLAVSDPAYLKAFRSLAIDVQRGHLTWGPAERTAVENVATASRAMALSPDSAGGFAVPFALDPSFVVANPGSVNPIRSLARVESVTSDSWNGVRTAGSTASWTAEGQEVGDNSPTLAQPSVPIHKAHAFVPASIEASMDIPNFAEQVAKVLLDARDQLEAETFVSGTGVGQPTGIVTALAGTSSVLPSTTAATFALADVYRLIEKLAPRYRPNAAWGAPLEIINAVRQFATANNFHAFLTDLAGDIPARRLGKPLAEVSGMDGSITAATTNYALVVGDWSHYLIADRIGATIEFIPHLFGANGRPTGQRGSYLYWRSGADSINDDAFALLDVNDET